MDRGSVLCRRVSVLDHQSQPHQKRQGRRAGRRPIHDLRSCPLPLYRTRHPGLCPPLAAAVQARPVLHPELLAGRLALLPGVAIAVVERVSMTEVECGPPRARGASLHLLLGVTHDREAIVCDGLLQDLDEAVQYLLLLLGRARGSPQLLSGRRPPGCIIRVRRSAPSAADAMWLILPTERSWGPPRGRG